MFTLGANTSSLGVLQTALSTAISSATPMVTQSALSDLQRLSSLQDIHSLHDLTRPDNLARMAANPVLFHDVARALRMPGNVGREVFQRETRGERMLPAHTPAMTAAPAAAQTAPATTSSTTNLRPAMCAMDWVGADIPDEEVANIDRTAQRTPAEIAHAIFSEKRESQNRVRIQDMEKKLLEYATQLDLRQGVQIFRWIPTAINEKLDKLLSLAWRISKHMDGEATGEYRDTLHRTHSRDVILRYLDMAREEGPQEALAMLEESLSLYDAVYGGNINLNVLKNWMSASVKDMLPEWPAEVTLENLGPFAISLRHAFDANGKELTSVQRYHLMRLAIALDGAAFGLGVYNEGEAGTQLQALKLATLIEVLYGTGFGDERWLAVSARLRQMYADWGNLGPHQGAEELARYGALAAHMLKEGKASYHSFFDDLVRTHGRQWGLEEHDIRSFTRSRYRTGALFPLGMHLAALHAGNGNHNRVEQILDRLHQDRNMSRIYAPIFLGEGRQEDLLDMGNKGKGLNELIKMGEAVPSGFALPPVLMSRDDVTEVQLATINGALDDLERRTGKSFDDGSLKVSVRSGASVSMPGTLLTVIKVGSREEAIAAIRTVYSSWDNPSAQLYRRFNGVPEDFGTSVIVQEWIETDDHPDSGFGLATSASTSEPLVRYGRQAQGIDLVSGKHPGRDALDEDVQRELNAKIRRYENHFRHPVEVEYAVERGKIWMLQIRRAQLSFEDEIRWTAHRIREGHMTREEGLAFLGGRERLTAALNEPRLLLQDADEPIVREAKGGGRPLVGSLALDEAGITTFQGAGLQAIFVTDNADSGKSAAYAFEAGAAIFNEGNGVSHLEGDLRASNRPHVGGIPVTIDRHARTVTIAGNTLKEGDVVTLDPANGAVYRGPIPIQEGDSPVASLIRWLMG